MDPGADADPPPPDVNGGDIGAPPPAAGGRLAIRSDDASAHSHRSIGSSDIRDSLQNNNPPSLRSPSSNSIILRISPAAGSATFGYVYMAETEIRHRDAIIAYFDSAGREVAVLPCPDFESFIAANSLMYRDVMFISDLPRYVIPAVRTPHPRGKRVQRFSSPRLASGTAGSFELPRFIRSGLFVNQEVPFVILAPIPHPIISAGGIICQDPSAGLGRLRLPLSPPLSCSSPEHQRGGP